MGVTRSGLGARRGAARSGLGAWMVVARCCSWFQDGCLLVWSWCQSEVLSLGARLGASHKKNASVLSSCFPQTSLDVVPFEFH